MFVARFRASSGVSTKYVTSVVRFGVSLYTTNCARLKLRSILLNFLLVSHIQPVILGGIDDHPRDN